MMKAGVEPDALDTRAARSDHTPVFRITLHLVPAPRAHAVSLRFLRIIDDEDEVLGPDLPQPVRAAGARQHRGARSDLHLIAVEGHDAAAAQEVIDLVFALLVIADRRTGLHDAL